METRKERTGWRDQRISQRHRDYGWNCPGVDIDFLMIEYDASIPKALVEYKAIGAISPDLNTATYKALRWLADKAGIPSFVAFYDANGWFYKVIPNNRRALDFVKWPGSQWLSEREYVTLMYHVRGRTIPPDVLEKLSTAKRP